MACVETEDDEGFGSIWKCGCGHWNTDDNDECFNCGRWWE